jgi:undecaprenyl-diphosphatase
LEKHLTRGATSSITEIGFGQAIAIGTIQSLSVIPGVSRALATIFGGLAVGLDKKTATEFSFLLTIPTMAAATGYDLLKTGFLFSSQEYLMLFVGFILAFVSALLTVKWLVNFVASHSFRLFAFYRIILAVVFILLG